MLDSIIAKHLQSIHHCISTKAHTVNSSEVDRLVRLSKCFKGLTLLEEILTVVFLNVKSKVSSSRTFWSDKERELVTALEHWTALKVELGSYYSTARGHLHELIETAMSQLYRVAEAVNQVR